MANFKRKKATKRTINRRNAPCGNWSAPKCVQIAVSDKNNFKKFLKDINI